MYQEGNGSDVTNIIPANVGMKFRMAELQREN
jgi:hypothetical protein